MELENKVISDKYLAFLKQLYDSGTDLDKKKLKILSDNGLISDKNYVFANTEEEEISIKELAKKELKEKESNRRLRSNITKEEWLPESKTEHEKDFVEFVDSINSGFKNRVYYEKFELYCNQADYWLSQEKNENLDDEEYEMQEIDKCYENTLYFIDKYIYVKDSEEERGSFKYRSTPSLRTLIYLYDCGYNIIFVKPRQVAATTTLNACALKSLIFRRNHFIKFITQDEEKGIEIFNDKVQYPYTELPEFMRPTVKNSSQNTFAFGYGKKGEKEGANSRMQVSAPTETAISGGSPSEIFIDEAGNIRILSRILENGMPTLFRKDASTGKIRMLRRFIAWGTGGEMAKGGQALYTEFMSVYKKWNERDFRPCIVPIFFDWTTRPGIDQSFYDTMKNIFYSKDGPDAEKSKIEFHQQYPTTLDDVFMTQAKTLVDGSFINNQITRIARSNTIIKNGYFEPVFDYSHPYDESSDIPYKVIGSNFIPTEDNDPRKTVSIFLMPEKGWVNRYYQGTDPIASDAGLSNMASCVWDKEYSTIAATLNFRSTDTHYIYLQVMLLGLFYSSDGVNPISELLEANIGMAYRQYKISKGRNFENSLVLNSELPQIFRTASNLMVGIDTKERRKRLVVDKLFELINIYGERIYMPIFYYQLKTFTCEITGTGKETWGPIDRRYHRDDVLDATAFSYICMLSFPNKVCENKAVESKKLKIVSRLAYDKNWNLKRVNIKKKI